MIYSAQAMSVNTANEYTSYMSNVHEVTKTLVQVTFNVKEVMFLIEMTNFHSWMTRCTRKFGPVWKRCLTKMMIMISSWTIFSRKISRFLNRKENLLNSTCSRRQTVHVTKASKTRNLLTGVQSGDFIDSEGNLVSVDADFSHTTEVHDLVKQTLKIEM